MRQDAVQALFVVPLPAPATASTAQSSSKLSEGATSYFGAVIIGFPREIDMIERDLRAALLLTRDIATDHQPPLGDLISRIAPIFSSSAKHPQWGTAGGLLRLPQTSGGGTNNALTDGTAGSSHEESQPVEDPEEDEEDYTAQDEFGSIILSPVQYEILDAVTPWTLEFPERVLEVQYRRWRGERMVTVDTMAFVVLLAYHTTRKQSSYDDYLSSNERFIGRSFLEWVPCVMVAVPLLLAVLPRAQEWYARRRDFLMGGLYVILICHHLVLTPSIATRMRALEYPLDAVPPALTAMETALELLSSLDGLWMSVLSIILHVRHPWQLFMMTAAVGISLVVAPPLCPTGAIPWACWAAIAARITMLQLIAPAFILYMLEYGARKAFCATPFASAWVWRAELQRFPS